jgi:hypothetical protein
MDRKAEFEISDADLEAAERRGRAYLASVPLATSARYDPKRRRVVLELNNGSMFAFPTEAVEFLQGASHADLADIEVWGEGYALRWDKLDVDFTVPGLLAGIFGTKRYMAQLAGRAKSPAKAAAARANGAKGGRPRKTADR